MLWGYPGGGLELADWWVPVRAGNVYPRGQCEGLTESEGIWGHNQGTEWGKRAFSSLKLDEYKETSKNSDKAMKKYVFTYSSVLGGRADYGDLHQRWHPDSQWPTTPTHYLFTLFYFQSFSSILSPLYHLLVSFPVLRFLLPIRRENACWIPWFFFPTALSSEGSQN